MHVNRAQQMAAAPRDSEWMVVPNAGKDDQGDEWFAFGSRCGVVGTAVIARV